MDILNYICDLLCKFLKVLSGKLLLLLILFLVRFFLEVCKIDFGWGCCLGCGVFFIDDFCFFGLLFGFIFLRVFIGFSFFVELK